MWGKKKKNPKKTPTSAGPKIRLAPPPSPVRHAWGFNGPPGASGADGRVTFTDTGDKKRETERESDAAAAKNDKWGFICISLSGFCCSATWLAACLRVRVWNPFLHAPLWERLYTLPPPGGHSEKLQLLKDKSEEKTESVRRFRRPNPAKNTYDLAGQTCRQRLIKPEGGQQRRRDPETSRTKESLNGLLSDWPWFLMDTNTWRIDFHSFPEGSA